MPAFIQYCQCIEGKLIGAPEAKINLKGMSKINMFIVYKTDTWHSHKSRDIIGVATNLISAITMCEIQAQKEDELFNNDQLFNLSNIKQTQGYSGEGEFFLEETKIDTLL